MLQTAGGCCSGGLHFVVLLFSRPEQQPPAFWNSEPTNSAGSPSRQGPRERGSRREAPAELLEIGTYNSAAHHTAHHIEVVGVGHVLHPRGHPPADGGVREFKSLFVERIVLGIRHCGSIPLILKRERGRERGGPRVHKLVKSRYLNIVYFGFGN